MREILTPEQVAEYLQLTTDTVYRLIRQHRLAASRIGRTYRIPKEDVVSFLLAHSSRPAVRAALFERVSAVGRRNAERDPELTSDAILDQLEAEDEESPRRRATRG